MVMSNRTPVTSYLTLLDRLQSESSYSVWHNVIQALAMIDRLERGQSGRAAFQAFVCTLLGPLFPTRRVGCKSDEELATKLLRSDLIQTLGRSAIGLPSMKHFAVMKNPEKDRRS